MTPSSTTLGRPPTAVVTIGKPTAIASGTTSGSPSVSLDSANTSKAGSRRGTSMRRPVITTQRGSGSRATSASTAGRLGPSPTITSRTRLDRCGAIARTSSAWFL